MNFHFQIGKCTEAVCEFLDRAGGQINVMKLVKLLEEIPDNPDAPTDGAAQHDHYLYGLPKRP